MGFENLDRVVFEIIMRPDSQNMCWEIKSRNNL
jgi:hypothetical protein